MNDVGVNPFKTEQSCSHFDIDLRVLFQKEMILRI